MIIVKVNGVDYQIPSSKLNELLVWLQNNQATAVIDNSSLQSDGRTIING
jgi:hypothetical protein